MCLITVQASNLAPHVYVVIFSVNTKKSTSQRATVTLRETNLKENDLYAKFCQVFNLA